MRKLWPPIELIESRLFNRDGTLLPEAEMEEYETEIETTAGETPEALAEVPPQIAELIGRRVAARRATGGVTQKPAAGQIVLIQASRPADVSTKVDNPDALVVLLSNESGEPGRWSGWVVAQEPDYASCWDVVFEEDDGPIDPIAAVVQLWNPVTVRVPSGAVLLGQLSPDRLEALRSVESEYKSGQLPDVRPRPGQVGIRRVGRYSLLTGTPLGGADDLRHAFQALYRQAAQSVGESPRVAETTGSGATTLEQIARMLEDWARGVGARWTRVPLQAQPMGGAEEREWITYGWADRLIVGLRLEAPNEVLRVNLRLVSGQPVRVVLRRDDEPLQSAELRPEQPEFDVLIDTNEPHTLEIIGLTGKITYKIPFPGKRPS